MTPEPFDGLPGVLERRVRRRHILRRTLLNATHRRAPLPVETLLILAPLVRSIVLPAALIGLLAAVVITATEWTVEILPMRVPRMREKANSAMAAVDRAACQIGMIAQDSIERQLILTNKRTDAIVLIPIGAKCEEFPGGYDKNARFSVKMLSVLDTSSSYSLDANASSGRARIFYVFTPNREQRAGAIA